jgi:general secretion pathway protein G
MKRFSLSLAALAMLLGAATPSRPTRGLASQRLDELARDVEAYRKDAGDLPSSLEGLDGIASSERLLADPWGNPIYYLRVAGGYWLMSWGADGEPGGEGDAADVVHIAR